MELVDRGNSWLECGLLSSRFVLEAIASLFGLGVTSPDSA
jgi:hypothetical protein